MEEKMFNSYSKKDKEIMKQIEDKNCNDMGCVLALDVFHMLNVAAKWNTRK